MLAVLALWAAVPVFACLTPSPQDDCCQKMQAPASTCDMDASQSCCQVHSRPGSHPLGKATLTHRPPTLVSPACQSIPLSASAILLPKHTRESNPLLSPPGASVLRI
jgi:hypothetical protein